MDYTMFQANLSASPSLVRIWFSNLTMSDSLPRKLRKKTILSTSRKGLEMIDLVLTKETKSHAQAHNQD
jgi:hypothetical protein